MVALGNISSIGGLDTKCTSLRQRILKIGLIGFSWEHQKILLNQPIVIFCLLIFLLLCQICFYLRSWRFACRGFSFNLRGCLGWIWQPYWTWGHLSL